MPQNLMLKPWVMAMSGHCQSCTGHNVHKFKKVVAHIIRVTIKFILLQVILLRHMTLGQRIFESITGLRKVFLLSKI